MRSTIAFGAVLALALGSDATPLETRQDIMQANFNTFEDEACGTLPLQSVVLLADSYNKCGNYEWDFKSVMPQIVNTSCEREFPMDLTAKRLRWLGLHWLTDVLTVTFYSEPDCEGTPGTIDLFSCGSGGQSYKLTC